MRSLIYPINSENFDECIEVSKEIFWMYYDIITTNCIMHGVDYEKVEFEKYIMCEIIEESLKTDKFENVVKLVREGCFTALCCYVLIIMEENLNFDNILEFIESMLKENKFEHMQFEKETLMIMRNMLNNRVNCLEKEDKYWTEYPEAKKFTEKLNEIYERFVLGHYKSMIIEGGNLQVFNK